MKIFIYQGKGVALGCTIFVLAENLTEAIVLITKRLKTLKLLYQPFHPIIEKEIIKGCFYSDNGDY